MSFSEHPFLAELAARRRLGMKPGLETISAVCAAMGDPQRTFRAIHVAGTNGKGAVCAILDAALRAAGRRVGRYTSPHLVSLNERFFLDGRPAEDAALERIAVRVPPLEELTFFEALTAVAFAFYAESKCDHVILETGLGGRLDATNVCRPEVCVITKIGLDHCDWLGDTVEKIAAEKAGIVKPGVPVVIGRNAASVRAVIASAAAEHGAPCFYAPELVDPSEVPDDFSLPGSFNRENAQTALAALKVMNLSPADMEACRRGFASVVWPGRFQRVGGYLVDGAHNPPAAEALAAALSDLGVAPKSVDLVAGFCGDKDVDDVLAVLAPFVRRGLAVKTNNPRSLEAAETAAKMRTAGFDAEPCSTLAEALYRSAAATAGKTAARLPKTLVCGSLFLAGEALVALGAYEGRARFDAAESLRPA